MTGKRTCIEIGKILSFDMLINNWDRLPYIWNNEGNLGNLMVTNDINRPIVGIDQSMSSIHPVNFKGKFDEYLKKIRDALDEIKNKQFDGPIITTVRNFLKSSVMYDIGPEGLQYVFLGLASGIKVRRY